MITGSKIQRNLLKLDINLENVGTMNEVIEALGNRRIMMSQRLVVAMRNTRLMIVTGHDVRHRVIGHGIRHRVIGHGTRHRVTKRTMINHPTEIQENLRMTKKVIFKLVTDIRI